MQCPFCGQDNDRVVDSRSSEGGRAVRRRRQCGACGKRYTTYERPEETFRMTVIKRDGTREPYDRAKIVTGLQRACYKRPVGDDQIRQITDAAEEAMLQNFDRDVPSSFIGDAVAMRLREVDKIAYVRFASVYRRFADVGQLIDEAQEIKDAPMPGPDQKGLFDKDTDEHTDTDTDTE